MSAAVWPRKQNGPPPSLTPWQWLCLAGKITKTLSTILSKAVRALVRPPPNDQTLTRYVQYLGMRLFQSSLNAIETQNVLPSTDEVCRRFAKKHGLAPSDVKLSDGTMVHWIGSPAASRVIAHFHGGGYVAPALYDHISIVYEHSSPWKDVAVLVLSYDLASESMNHYPRQLQQAVSMLDYLINDAGKKPSNITLVGNSAGAHLALGVLLHLSHPNPLVPKLEIDGQLGQAVLCSPWVTFDVSAGSMEANKDKDIVCASSLAYWGRNLLGGADVDPWNTPLSAPREWWCDLRVGDILVLYGGDEILRDHSAEFGERLKASHARAAVHEFPGECHEEMLINRSFNIKTCSQSEKIFSQWMEQHFGPGKLEGGSH